jgi:hypothetical protein
VVPAGAKSVAIMSRFCIPSDKMIARQRDTRRLGVRVNSISILSNNTQTILSADHPGLEAGWNEAECDDQTIWRWTDGAGMIPWDSVTGVAVVTVRCTTVDLYPLYDDKVRLVA